MKNSKKQKLYADNRKKVFLERVMDPFSTPEVIIFLFLHFNLKKKMKEAMKIAKNLNFNFCSSP